MALLLLPDISSRLAWPVLPGFGGPWTYMVLLYASILLALSVGCWAAFRSLRAAPPGIHLTTDDKPHTFFSKVRHYCYHYTLDFTAAILPTHHRHYQHKRASHLIDGESHAPTIETQPLLMEACTDFFRTPINNARLPLRDSKGGRRVHTDPTLAALLAKPCFHLPSGAYHAPPPTPLHASQILQNNICSDQNRKSSSSRNYRRRSDSFAAKLRDHRLYCFPALTGPQHPNYPSIDRHLSEGKEKPTPDAATFAKGMRHVDNPAASAIHSSTDCGNKGGGKQNSNQRYGAVAASAISSRPPSNWYRRGFCPPGRSVWSDKIS